MQILARVVWSRIQIPQDLHVYGMGTHKGTTTAHMAAQQTQRWGHPQKGERHRASQEELSVSLEEALACPFRVGGLHRSAPEPTAQEGLVTEVIHRGCQIASKWYR